MKQTEEQELHSLIVSMGGLEQHAVRRAGWGHQVEVTSWNYGASERAKTALIESGLMQLAQTPKGKKRFLTLTVKGHRAVAVLAKIDLRKEAERLKEREEQDRLEKLRTAGPQLAQALADVLPWAEAWDEDHLSEHGSEEHSKCRKALQNARQLLQEVGVKK